MTWDDIGSAAGFFLLVNLIMWFLVVWPYGGFHDR